MPGTSLLEINNLCLFVSLMSLFTQRICLAETMPGASLLKTNTLCLIVSLMSIYTKNKTQMGISLRDIEDQDWPAPN